MTLWRSEDGHSFYDLYVRPKLGANPSLDERAEALNSSLLGYNLTEDMVRMNLEMCYEALFEVAHG